MKKQKLLLKLVISIWVMLLAFNCGGSGEKKEDKGSSRKKRADVPSWFLAPPYAEDALYAVGYSKKANLQLALTTAANRARDELSRVLGVKVANMVKDFIEEGTVGSDKEKVGQVTEFSQTVSKSLTENVLNMTRIDQQELYELEDGNYEAFVLIKLSLADLSSKVDEIMKNNAAAYAKLQANKAFEDLNKELKSLKGSDPDLKAKEGSTDNP